MRLHFSLTSLSIVLFTLPVIVSLFVLLPYYTAFATSHCPPTIDEFDPAEHTIKVFDGFFSAKPTPAPDSSLVVGTDVKCLTGTEAHFETLTYGAMLARYYEDGNSDHKESKGTTSSVTEVAVELTDNGPMGISGDKNLYHVYDPTGGSGGNLTINNDFDIKIPGVVFVDGDLLINSNITLDTNTSGVVFVVQGDVNIKYDVQEIHAFIITFGTFCSAYDPSTSSCTGEPSSPPNDGKEEVLTIYGSVISLNQGSPPNFVRDIVNPTPDTPAERLVYEPKYLVLVKDIFSRDKIHWREIQ